MVNFGQPNTDFWKRPHQNLEFQQIKQRESDVDLVVFMAIWIHDDPGLMPAGEESLSIKLPMPY